MYNILQQLEQIEDIESKRLAIIIRHGERPEIPEGVLGDDVLLTEQGKAKAIEFGQLLAPCKVSKIFSSPWPRCVATAECIRQGLGSNIEIVQDKYLVSWHVVDSEKSRKSFDNYKVFGIFEKFVQNEEIPGMASQDLLRTKTMQWLNNHTSGRTVFVTHDALIAHFAFANNIHTYSKEHWVNFLDGIIVDFSESPLE